MSEHVQTGLDSLENESCARLGDRRVGLLANPASVTADLRHVSAILLSAGVNLACIFGPQHGYRGNTQANMIEWEGYNDSDLGIPVHSLYGERREPSGAMLAGLDAVIIDLPDVGARPYTYLWTAVLMMRRCAATGAAVLVLDRPNPIGGTEIEGPILEEEYISFVGLHPIPQRHGLTIGETLAMIHWREKLSCPLDIVAMTGWNRTERFEETGLPWVLPSPNIPTPLTALLYTGTVMLEGTNISEGRGTTRPFEIIGAPWIEPARFSRELAGCGLPGAVFRPLWFTPTWDKYAGELCGGVQIHVVDGDAFRPVRCCAMIIAAAARLYPERFEWLNPPYEYDHRHRPIDIITGGPHLREAIDGTGDLGTLFERWKRDEDTFLEEREPYLIY